MPSRQIAKVQEIHAPASPNCGHAVQFYESDLALIEELGRHIGSAMEAGDNALVVATKTHRQGLAQELKLRGIDKAAAIKAGSYIELDAAETLKKFMVGGGPDKLKFVETVGALVSRALAETKPG